MAGGAGQWKCVAAAEAGNVRGATRDAAHDSYVTGIRDTPHCCHAASSVAALRLTARFVAPCNGLI